MTTIDAFLGNAAAVISYALPGGERRELTTTNVAKDLHELSGWALAEGVELLELEIRRPSLEDVYLELIGEHQ